MCEKKNVAESWNGLLPIFFLIVSHNTASCIVTHGLTGMAWETCLGAQQERRGTQGVHRGRAWSAMIQPAGPRYRPQHGRQHVHRLGWWIVSRYMVLYRDRSEGLAVGGCVMIQSLYRDRRGVWIAGVSRYN